MAFNLKVFSTLVRTYRSKARNIKNNSGIQKRLALIKETQPDLENIKITEQEIENLESGLLNAENPKDYIIRGVKKRQHFIESKKIERKFFKKEKYPNLLTWSEKEQIRFLYNSDPVTWSVEKLSESFPSTPDILQKIIKSQWKPWSSERIISHDKTVQQNWIALEKGRLKLPKLLEDHVKIFISRKKAGTFTIPDAGKSLEKVSNSTYNSSEFLNIIKAYKNNLKADSDEVTEESISVNTNTKLHKSETYVLEKEDNLKLKYKYYTLNQLKAELNSDKPSSSVTEALHSKQLAKECEPLVNREIINYNFTDSSKNSKNKIGESTLKIDDCTEEIPLKIRLPNKRSKSKMQVFKVKDCYYDQKGEFLYKVPGMS